MAKGERSMHTTLLAQEFTRADVILNERLDGLIRQFNETNPDFVMAYKNARKITDTGSKPNSPAAPTTPPTP